jgi:hypothetical protein
MGNRLVTVHRLTLRSTGRAGSGFNSASMGAGEFEQLRVDQFHRTLF